MEKVFTNETYARKVPSKQFHFALLYILYVHIQKNNDRIHVVCVSEVFQCLQSIYFQHSTSFTGVGSLLRVELRLTNFSETAGLIILT
jgi:hypothetical protein